MSSNSRGCEVYFCAGALAVSGSMFLISLVLLAENRVADLARDERKDLESDLTTLLDAHVKCRVDGVHPSHIRELVPYLPHAALNYSVDGYMLVPDAGPFDPIIVAISPELAEMEPKGITAHGKFTFFSELERSLPPSPDSTETGDSDEGRH